MNSPSERRLYSQSEVASVLQLTTDEIDWLMNTRQLAPIRICGQLRFDSRDVNDLIETYRHTATRKSQ